MEQSYEITEDGLHAKTLNPWIDYKNLKFGHSEWEEAEQQRVTYEIEPTWDKIYFDPKDSTKYKLREHKHTPGQIVKAEIINGKLRIL